MATTTTLSDASEVCSKLREWSIAKRLSEAKLLEISEAGGDYYLVLDNVRLLSTVKLTIQDQQDATSGKSCEYSLGSIYLQIVDPDQRLVTYRGACKKYKVNDPIKATDKATVVSFFLGSTTSAVAATASATGETATVAAAVSSAEPPPAEAAAVADATADAAPPAAEAAVEQQEEGAIAVAAAESGDAAAAASLEKKSSGEHGEGRKSSSEDRHHRSKEHRHKSSSSDKHRDHHRSKGDKSSHKHKSSSRDKDGKRKEHHRKHGKDDASSPKKKAPKLVTNEELYNNLNVVVGKRTTGAAPSEGDAAAAAEGGEADGMEGISMLINTPFDAAADAAMRRSKEQVTKALSAVGFDVTPELLEEDAARTLQILQNEIPVGNSASILRAANPRKDLSRVLEIFNETMAAAATSTTTSSTTAAAAAAAAARSKSGNKPPPPTSRKPTPGTAAAAAATAASASSGGSPSKIKSYLIGKKPVIIVPKGMTAPITMINALDFFEKGIFVPRDVMLKKQRLQKTANAAVANSSGGGVTSSSSTTAGGSMTFTRTVRSGGNTGLVEYEILDNPKKLGSNIKDWERIVAVIVLGQGWQFKDWYHNYGNPVHLFAKTFGFFIYMEGDKLPAEIHGWSVRQAKLNRDKRGMDSVTFASFWNGLDEWMTVHKRELLPQAPN